MPFLNAFLIMINVTMTFCIMKIYNNSNNDHLSFNFKYLKNKNKM